MREKQVHRLRPPEMSGPQEKYVQAFSPARSRWIAKPGRIGFMSTQRRESRWRRTSYTERTEASRHTSLASDMQYGRAYANSGTAPPGTPARLATNSLQTDHHLEQFVRCVQLVRLATRCGSPPPRGAGRCAATGTPATHRSSLLHIPIPSGFALLHPTLPQAPAGRRRWAERYDGKRDLYLQHAA
jgi:hypothetical protein